MEVETSTGDPPTFLGVLIPGGKDAVDSSDNAVMITRS